MTIFFSWHFSIAKNLTLHNRYSPQNRELLDEQEVSIINEIKSIDQYLELVKAYPNPFNASINITYTINHRSNIHLNIFDLNGRLITNHNLGMKQSGDQYLYWSPDCFISSGTYLYSIESDKNIINGKILYLK